MTEPNPLNGFRVPGPTPGLRERTLNAARTVSAREPRPEIAGWVTSQPLWTAVVASLLIVHLALGSILGVLQPSRRELPRNTEIAEQPDLLDLPRLDGADMLGMLDGGGE
jgi:hypothetical protein